MNRPSPKRIYLAGPDIYQANALDRGQEKLDLCARYGHQGYYPLPQPFPKGTKHERSVWIYNTNSRIIKASDVLIADLNPSPGDQPDTGTVFEIGFAIGNGKPVLAYRHSTRPMNTMTNRGSPHTPSPEDYDLPVSLMLGVPVRLIQGGLEDALKALNALSDRHTKKAANGR